MIYQYKDSSPEHTIKKIQEILGNINIETENSKVINPEKRCIFSYTFTKRY